MVAVITPYLWIRVSLHLSPKIKNYIAKKLLNISTWMSNMYFKINLFQIKFDIFIIKLPPIYPNQKLSTVTEQPSLPFTLISKSNQGLISLGSYRFSDAMVFLPFSICKYSSHFHYLFHAASLPPTLYFTR